jgi:hypothetical protein
MNDKNTNDDKANRADFIDSIVIIAVSLFVLYECAVMPRYERWGLYATPGMPPFLFALMLLILGTIVFVRSIIRKGYKLHIGRNELSQFVKSGDVRRFVLVLGLILVYLFLLGRVHFAILSVAYLFLTILLFKGATWWVSGIVAVTTAVAVWLVFEVIFLVPLP